MTRPRDLSRRRLLLLGGAAIGAGALLTACTGNERRRATAAQTTAAAPAATGGNDAPGKKVIIGFSAPAADHGWIAAITKNAEAAGRAVLATWSSSRSRPTQRRQPSRSPRWRR